MTYLSHIIILLFTFSAIASADGVSINDSPANDNNREMTGLYSYMADAAGFIECGQKKRFPVAMEADNITLERAYLDNIYMPGKSLLVTIKGHFSLRKKMEGDGQEEVIIVTQFISLAQQERCHGEVPPASLANTYWKLVELNGERLDRNKNWLASQQSGASKELHFIIKQDSAKQNVITGFSACHQFSSIVTYDNVALQIKPVTKPIGTDKTECQAMLLEQNIQNMLHRTDTYRIKGEQLELLAGNHVVGKFIAIYF